MNLFQFARFVEGRRNQPLLGLEELRSLLDGLAGFRDFLRLAGVVRLSQQGLAQFLRNLVGLALELRVHQVIGGVFRAFGLLVCGFLRWSLR